MWKTPTQVPNSGPFAFFESSNISGEGLHPPPLWLRAGFRVEEKSRFSGFECLAQFFVVNHFSQALFCPLSITRTPRLSYKNSELRATTHIDRFLPPAASSPAVFCYLWSWPYSLLCSQTITCKLASDIIKYILGLCMYSHAEA